SAEAEHFNRADAHPIDVVAQVRRDATSVPGGERVVEAFGQPAVGVVHWSGSLRSQLSAILLIISYALPLVARRGSWNWSNGGGAAGRLLRKWAPALAAAGDWFCSKRAKAARMSGSWMAMGNPQVSAGPVAPPAGAGTADKAEKIAAKASRRGRRMGGLLGSRDVVNGLVAATRPQVQRTRGEARRYRRRGRD